MRPCRIGVWGLQLQQPQTPGSSGPCAGSGQHAPTEHRLCADAWAGAQGDGMGKTPSSPWSLQAAEGWGGCVCAADEVVTSSKDLDSNSGLVPSFGHHLTSPSRVPGACRLQGYISRQDSQPQPPGGHSANTSSLRNAESVTSVRISALCAWVSLPFNTTHRGHC